MTQKLWLIRLGKYGENEMAALDTGDCVTGWTLDDLSNATDRDAIYEIVETAYPDRKAGTLKNWAIQLNQLCNNIQHGDLIVLPLKTRREIAVGEVLGPYKHVRGKHPARSVKWLKQDIPREALKQDLLYSLGAAQTICQIWKNNALERIHSLLRTGKDPGDGININLSSQSNDDEAFSTDPIIDLKGATRDQIERKITSTFSGHSFTELVAAILKAQGYIVHVSPPGPDAGYDIVAGRGALGFDPPRLVVQVKSGGVVVDHPTLQSLNGCVQAAGAEHGLIVSWSGFKSTVTKETSQQYFRIRFWDREKLLEALFNVYNDLPEDLRAALPLQRIWALVPDDNEGAE